MSQLPHVSIIINNYNYGHFLGDAINSALRQTYSPIEVIVVDDGSIDYSQAVIQRYGDRIVPVLKPNGGQASAFNAGFAASQGDILCFLDADDQFLPEKVDRVVKAFQNYPQSNWCFHPLQRVDTREILIDQIDCHGLQQEFDFRQDLQLGKLRKVTNILPFTIPATSGLCFRRSLLQQILPMPEAENIALNDTYLQLTSFALSPGIALDRALSFQRIHYNNAFTRRTNKTAIVARIHVLTAYWLRTNFPDLSNLSNQFFAKGLALYWRSGGVEAKSQKFVQEYLATAMLPERVQIMARALYRSIYCPIM